jgi:hypothetical protein
MSQRPAIRVLVCLLVSGCAAPTLTDKALTEEAKSSTQGMVSELHTSGLVAKAQIDGKTWWRYADVVVTDAETSATTVASDFSSRQPPTSDSDDVYGKTSSALADAAELITELRVAVRRHDLAEVRKVRARVERAADELEKLETSLR